MIITVYPIDKNKIQTGEVKKQSDKDPINNVFFDAPPELTGTEVAMRMGAIQKVLPKYPEMKKAEPSIPIPSIVTMRQARLALLQMGLLSQVELTIEAIENPTIKAEIKIEQEYAQEVNRKHQWVVSLSSEMGLTEDNLNELFLLASKL